MIGTGLLLMIHVNDECKGAPLLDVTWMPPDDSLDPQTLAWEFADVEAAIAAVPRLVGLLLTTFPEDVVSAGWIFIDVADSYREQWS